MKCFEFVCCVLLCVWNLDFVDDDDLSSGSKEIKSHAYVCT